MFDYVNENKRLVQVILALLILPFAFWGVSSSFRQSGGGALATVENENITQQEFETAFRQQQAEISQRFRGRVDAAMFDTPEFKAEVLDQLINQKLLLVKARAAGLELTDRQLAQMIAGAPEFQTNEQYDPQKYEAWLRNKYAALLNNKGMTHKMLESQVKADLAITQMAQTFMQNGYASGTAADMVLRAREQQRTVSLVRIAPEPFLSQVKVDEAATKKYYEENQAEFSTPERARVEYVIFSAESLLPQVTVSAEDIKQYYDEHQSEYATPEQRRAAHILITPAPQSGEAGKKAAREQAESILAQLKAAPGKFAELAKKYSKDPASAAKGGDVGFFGRGMMVKSFDDAAFSLKPGETSGIVESEFGFHIIKLLEIKGGITTPLDQVKSAIAAKIKTQKAADKFADLAQKFSDAAYEQSDSLKPAAELVKAKVQESDWLEKGQRGAFPWTDKALQAVFSEDVLKKKRNSSAIEIASDRQIAVRLLDYKPAGARPYADVAESIRKKLMLQQAMELAAKQGQATLTQLQHGEKPALKWVAAKQPVSRMRPPVDMDGELARRVLQADISQLPAYVGAENPQGGYVLARVDAVKEAGQIDDLKRAAIARELSRGMGEELLQAYIADAKKHASISTPAFAAANGKN